MYISRAPLIYTEDSGAVEVSLKGMETNGCGLAHYELITIPSLKVRSIEPLIRALYINVVNVAEKFVNHSLTMREKAPNLRNLRPGLSQRVRLILA